MFTFQFKNFIDQLDILPPTFYEIPTNSPLYIFFTENGNLSKHEILKTFRRLLYKRGIEYLQPLNGLTSEWVFDLYSFRKEYKCLADVNYLSGKITIEPECKQEIKFNEYTQEDEVVSTTISFIVKPEDVIQNSYSENVKLDFSNDIKHSMGKFISENGDNTCGFLMMKFEDKPLQIKIVEIIRNFFESKKIRIFRADDKWYDDDLLTNIKTYMHGCSFGIALFDRINREDFNPNVSLEIGYMMALGKPVLLLKDSTLNSLQTDLVGKLYHEFDFQDPQNTIPSVLKKWIGDKEIE